MINEFHEAAKKAIALESSYFTGSARPVIGHTCSFVPEEILMAMDLIPHRIRGIPARETTIGDTYFGPYVCSLPKHLLQLAGEGRFRYLDGLVITPGCDSIRRLDDCLRKADTDLPGTRPPFFFHMGTPHKHEDFSISYFTGELNRLISELKLHFKIELDHQKLKRSIDICNKSRDLISRFQKLRDQDPGPVTGADSMAVFLSQGAMPREKFNSLLENLLNSAQTLPHVKDNRFRLMLAGSATDDIDLIRHIEGDRALIVTDNLCTGIRPLEEMVTPGDDPIRSLAEHYLKRCRCPRMFGLYRDRKKELLEKAAAAGVNGVILQNIRFCDLHGSENGLLERDFENLGIPCLRLEREYGTLVETGRLKMRVDAFLERVEKGGRL